MAELESLIEASAADDRAAFGALYDAVAPQLFGLALRILKRRDWAEDVLQEALISAWRNAGDYRRARGSGEVWLTAILRNRALDRLRHKADARQDPGGDATPEVPAEPVAPPAALRDRVLGGIDSAAEGEARPFSVLRWLAWTFGASAIAAAVAVALVFLLTPRPPELGGYAMLHQQTASNAVVVVQIDKARDQLVLLAQAPDPGTGKDYELWVFPPGKGPVSLGVVKTGERIAQPIDAMRAALLQPGTTLAVSLEPAGGSSSGAPTGPVLFTGPFHLAGN